MAGKTPLKIAFVALIILGLGMITLGVVMPILIQKQIDEALSNTWMKTEDYSSWGKLPGKLGIKVVRGFRMYNVTNPEEVLKGETLNVTRLPQFSTQEYTKWFDWEYVEKDGKVKDVELFSTQQITLPFTPLSTSPT